MQSTQIAVVVVPLRPVFLFPHSMKYVEKLRKICEPNVYTYIYIVCFSVSVWQVKANHTVKFNLLWIKKCILHKICMHNLYSRKKIHLVGKCAWKLACRTRMSCTTPDQFHPFSIAKTNKGPERETLSAVGFIELLLNRILIESIWTLKKTRHRNGKYVQRFEHSSLSSTLKV